MNKNYVLSFFLINLFAISNLYPTIVRTVVLKHKTTGQQIVLYGDYHLGLKDFQSKDASQFEYISKLIERNKEGFAQKISLFHEGDRLAKNDKCENKLLLCKIASSQNKWIEFVSSIENRDYSYLESIEHWGRQEYYISQISWKHPAIETLFRDSIFKLDSLFKKVHKYSTNFEISKKFNGAFSKALLKIENFEEWLCSFVDNCNRVDFRRLHDFMITEFFDLNAFCQIITCDKPMIALFAGDGHVQNLRDTLVKDCNYELKYDSGIILHGKKFEKLEEVKHMIEEVSPVENKDFDLMLTPWNDSKAGA